MEGARRALFAFDYSIIQKLYFSVFPCFRTENSQKVRFRDQWLNVVPAVDPDLLIWENLGLPWPEHYARTFVFYGFLVGILFACFYSILALEYESQKQASVVPNVSCRDNITLSEAYLDSISKNRNGDYHCFCQNAYYLMDYSYINNLLFPDGKTRCSQWFKDYWKSTILGSLIVITMGVVNLLTELVVGFGSGLTRPGNHTSILKDTIVGISWIQFINLGSVLIIISMKVHLPKNVHLPHGFFDGKYNELDSNWYVNVGTIIIQTLIIEIGIPHITPILQLVGYSIWRCQNRSWSCDKRRSKYILQSDYENIYTGPEFNMDYRLA
jgi:hypothetical protein